MFKLAVFTDEVSQDFQRAVDVSLEYNLDGLEIRSVWDKPPQDLSSEDVGRMKEILEDTGLSVCSIASPFFKCDIDSEEECRDHIGILRRCIALAQGFDCSIIRGFTFWRKGRLGDNWQKILDKFEEPVEILRQEGVRLAIENESSTSIGTGRRLARFLRELDSPWVEAIWDPANSIFDEDEQEVPYPDGYEAIKDRMIHMHVKDASRDPETGKLECVPIGEGDIDFRGQFKALVRDGYEGYASLETHWRPRMTLSEEELNRPGGERFSTNAEEASRICLRNLRGIVGSL